MGWPLAFLSALRAGVPMRLQVHLYRLSVWGPGASTGTATSAADSPYIDGVGTHAALALSSSSVSVPAFTSARGSLRIALGSEAAGHWALRDLPRGSLVRVGMTAPGMSVSAPIAIGQVRDIEGIGPISVLSAWDLLSAVSSRQQWIGADQTALFYHCSSTSTVTRTLTTAYIVGDATLACNSTTSFGREGSGTGAVLVTPTSGADPFILTFTGLSGSTVTGCSSTGQHGTTAVNAGIGSTVQEVAWMVGRPDEVALKILVSTGAGTNGPNDVYPAAWGFGVPQALVDQYGGFAGVVNDIAPATGNHDVEIVSTVEQSEGLSWVETMLSRYAMWLTTRQGQVTIRAGVDWVSRVPPSRMTLDRTVLVGMPSRSVYDQGYAAEYARVETQWQTAGSSVSTSSTPATRPLLQTFVTDYEFELYQNQTAIASKLNERIGAWRTRIPTVVDVSATLIAAQLCPGDWVKLDHPGLWTVSRTLGHPVNAMVSAVSVDWSAGIVTLRLHIQHTAAAA